KEMSKAIVEINEMKSSIHNGAIPEKDIGHYILKIENKFPFITINRYVSNSKIANIDQKLLTNLLENHPSYLKNYSKDELNTILEEVKSEIYSKRGNQTWQIIKRKKNKSIMCFKIFLENMIVSIISLALNSIKHGENVL